MFHKLLPGQKVHYTFERPEYSTDIYALFPDMPHVLIQALELTKININSSVAR